MADSSYDISVSTVKDQVVARRVNLSGQARYLGGQISDKSYQGLMGSLSQLNSKTVELDGRGVTEMHGDDLGLMSCGGIGAGAKPFS